MKKSGKILLIVGTSIKSQLKFTRQLCKSPLNLKYLDSAKVFARVAKAITRDYFSKEIHSFEKLTNKKFISYLDLLFFIQKSQNPGVCKLYKAFYKKVQLVNKIILYRYYESLFLEINKITESGKNCVFIENIFNDPYPERKDIFFDFFNIFGNNFKILNIYTDIQTSINQTIQTNDIFMKNISSKKNNAGKIVKSNEFTLNNFEHPLFALELFPLMYGISKNQNHKSFFEHVKGKDLKHVYLQSIYQAKRILGFLIANQTPYFYHKHSILNEIGKNFIYIKDFKMNDNIYISNDRVTSDYTIIESNHVYDLITAGCPDNFLKTLTAWIKYDEYKPYIDKYIGNTANIQQHKQNTVIEDTLFQSSLSEITKNKIAKITKNHPPILIEDIYNQVNLSISLDTVTKSLFKTNCAHFFLQISETKWIAYIVNLLKDQKIQLMFFNNTNINFDTSDKHLIVINHLYIEIGKKFDIHFFIDCIDLHYNQGKYSDTVSNLDKALNFIQNNNLSQIS
jgi:hypothetical protein